MASWWETASSGITAVRSAASDFANEVRNRNPRHAFALPIQNASHSSQKLMKKLKKKLTASIESRRCFKKPKKATVDRMCVRLIIPFLPSTKYLSPLPFHCLTLYPLLPHAKMLLLPSSNKQTNLNNHA